MPLPITAVVQFGETDRRQIAEEMAANPRFGAWLAATLREPDGERQVALSAQKAIANEFNPALYPASRGQWLTLRKRALELARDLPEIVGREIERLPFPAKMQMVRAIAAGHEPVLRLGLSGMGDLGQFEIIGSLVSSIVGAASTVYSARVTASAQKDIAKIQATAAMKDLETQQTIANAQAAINQAKATQATAEAKKAEIALTQSQVGPPGSLTEVLSRPVVAGIPVWAFPLAGLIGLVVYLMFKRRK